MAKKLMDVEDVLHWACAELARKRPGKVVALPVFNVARGDREIVGRWMWPMGFPEISPMFSAGYARAGTARGDPPHADALIVEAALQRMALATIPVPLEDLTHGMGFALDVEGAAIAGAANLGNLMLVHGRLGTRPLIRADAPEPSPKLAPNGKPGSWRREEWAETTWQDHAQASRFVETPVAAIRGGQYPAGAYGVLEWTPDPQLIVNERAEYAAWRAGLQWLAEALSDAMETRAALPPRAAERPWMGDLDGDPPRDLYRPGADGIYGAEEAASLAAERRSGRRRPVSGGRVYAARSAKPAKGAAERG